MSPHSLGDWKHIAEQASQEMDSVKLLELVNELNRAFGEHEETSRSQRCQGNQKVQDSCIPRARKLSGILFSLQARSPESGPSEEFQPARTIRPIRGAECLRVESPFDGEFCGFS
jgi:hypothetical protein